MTPDPLPSWNDGPAKKAILDYVKKIQNENSQDYINPPKRFAAFDNDGTLWGEQPMYVQLAFILDRVKALAPKHPEWKTQEPFKSILAGDLKGVAASGEKGAAELVAATHAGMTTVEFSKIVADWLAKARHPKTGRPYTEMVYQPMLELLAYLRSQGFKTYIVSGGGVDFMRVFSKATYGIPLEQVIGSSGKLKYEIRDGKPVMIKLPEIDHIDDHQGKPVGIQKFIGGPPMMAFGNSDGDLQMIQWVTGSDGPRFGLIVHHTDAEREYAYDRQSHVGKLDKALDEAQAKGWTVVDMKKDWKVIYPASR